MVFFALPTSTAIYVLSSQLRSDTRLASAAIVVSTAGSLASLSVVLTDAGTCYRLECAPALDDATGSEIM